jgi:hypothetical protein
MDTMRVWSAFTETAALATTTPGDPRSVAAMVNRSAQLDLTRRSTTDVRLSWVSRLESERSCTFDDVARQGPATAAIGVKVGAGVGIAGAAATATGSAGVVGTVVTGGGVAGGGVTGGGVTGGGVTGGGSGVTTTGGGTPPHDGELVRLSRLCA